MCYPIDKLFFPPNIYCTHRVAYIQARSTNHIENNICIEIEKKKANEKLCAITIHKYTPIFMHL